MNFTPNFKIVFILLVLLKIAIPKPIFSSSSSDSTFVRAVKISEPIEIDGILNESVWTEGKAYDNFTQREPNNGESVSENTELKILYDDDNLYISFRCWDNNVNEIVANEMQRDKNLLNNDCIEIYLDTFHDKRSAFYFCTNPLGAQWDGIITSDLPDEAQNWDWNGVWDNSCTIDENGWIAEIKIPFKTLRFKNEEVLVWGANFSRYIARKREESFLTPISREFGWWGKYKVSSFGELNGLSNISQPEKLLLKPFLLTGITRDFEEESSYDKKLDFGFDAKYLLTSNLTLDLTLNTDFAQVEADQEQINLSRFELFLPEKREFFLERANIFQFGERNLFPIIPTSVLFFSRRIGLSDDNELVPLFGGAKLTGRAGNYNVGFLSMFSNNTSYYDDDDVLVSIPKTNFSSLRVQKDLGNNSTIGFIGLNKESLSDNSFNRTLGIDANIFLNENTQVGGFISKTFSPELEGNDYAFNGDILYLDDFWLGYAAQNLIQENFNAEMGFIPRTGTRRSQFNIGISPRPGILNIRQVTIFNNFNYFANMKSQLDSRLNLAGVWSVFNNGSNLFFAHSLSYERLTEEFEIHDDIILPLGIYEFGSFMGEYNSDMSQTISGKISTSFGNFYSGNIFGYGFGLNLRINSNFSTEFDFGKNMVELPVGDFTTTIMSARFIYTFSPKLFVKTFVQWNSSRDVIIGNLLFNLIHTPGSDLFFVYNEEIEKKDGNFKTLNRTILLKFTYLFSF